MARVVVQMGHVPRTTGATGTYREQEFVKALAPRIKTVLETLGHTVYVIDYDGPYPPGDAFVALHCDGSLNKAVRGGSVGYQTADGQRLAAAWKRAHQRRGYTGGFKPDNYTRDLAGYYGFGYAKCRYEFLAEHGHTTNPIDEAWLFANLDSCAAAHAEAIGEVLGHPIVPTGGGGVKLNKPAVTLAFTADEGGYWIFTADGGVFSFGNARFFGSLGSLTLNAPIVDVVSTPSGNGYWMLGKDGGIFAFGDAPFKGSAAGATTTATALVTTKSGLGYLIVAEDGGIFAFGDAPFHGSIPGLQ